MAPPSQSQGQSPAQLHATAARGKISIVSEWHVLSHLTHALDAFLEQFPATLEDEVRQLDRVASALRGDAAEDETYEGGEALTARHVLPGKAAQAALRMRAGEQRVLRAARAELVALRWELVQEVALKQVAFPVATLFVGMVVTRKLFS